MPNITRRDILKAGCGLALADISSAIAFAQKAAKPDPYADGVLIDGEPPLPRAGSFTIAVMPDTQNYSLRFPETYLAQAKWIAEQKSARNIACVLHLGDVTDRNTRPEWDVAQKAMQQLDGAIPYFMVTGNHDYSEKGNIKDRKTFFSEYFPIANFQNLSTFGGVYDKEPDRMENSFHRFSAGGRKFLVLGLEFGPRHDVVRWANEVVSANSDHEVILVTHAYMYYDDTRYDWKVHGNRQAWNPHSTDVAKNTKGDVMDGAELWDNLVSQHENFIMTLNGHVLNDGLGRLTSQTPGGRDVHQLLVNFQMRPNGGDGWLRLLEFQKDSGIVQCYDYSPVLQKRNESPQNQFALTLSPPKNSV